MPLCAALERKNFFLLALLFHFITVVAIDILTGACLSPSFCLGFLLKGSMTLPEAFIRGATDLLAGLTFTYLISTLHLMPLSSPSVSRDLTITEGFLVEAALTAAFFVVILFVSDIIPKFEIRRPIIATTIRLLITIGAPLTGCFMNPTIALPFAIVTTGSLSSTVLLVYGLGPVLGTLLAMALWSPLKVQHIV